MNTSDLMRRSLALLAMVSVLCVAAGLRADEPDAVFVERFDGGPGERWTIESPLDPPQLRWHKQGQTPGIHFHSVATNKYVKTRGYAWAEWPVGTRPFELRWDVELHRALQQQWFLPGVAVAMTSAPPGKMQADDVAVTMSVHMAGIGASVRRGGLFDTPTEGRGAWSGISDKTLYNPRGEGTGGVAAVAWPMKHPSGARLQFHIVRTDDNKLRFSVDWPGLGPDRGRPLWAGEYQLPDDVADVPLRYVSIKRMQTLSVHTNYSGFVMDGVVRDIRGRLLSADPAPAAQRFTQDAAVLEGGVALTVHGEHFREGAKVTVGGRPATNIRVESAEKLTLTLPDLPANKRYVLSVSNPNGLFADLDRKVAYGRMIDAVRPREASPEGGDVVSIRGAGFDDRTTVAIGGKPAKIVERVDPTHLKVAVPAGEVGPTNVTARSGDHAFAGEPLFGYAAHPYLFFRADDVPALREKFAKPMFKHYRKRILDNANRIAENKPTARHNASVSALFNLCFAYTLTGEQRYKQRLMDWVRVGWGQTQFDDFHLMSLAGMALAYDVLYPELSPEDRAAFQDYLDRGLDGYHKFSGAWFLGSGANFSNTVPVGNSGGMLAGLAMMHSTPQAKKAVDLAAAKVKRYPNQCIAPDGGCREGVQYWDFGGTFHLIVAHALNHATGDDRGLLDHPHLKANVNFVRATLGGHGGQFSFNDTRQPWLGGFAVMADLGSRYDQPLMLWAADLCAEGGEKTRARDTWAPFAFLWRSEQPAPDKFPGVPTLTYLQDMQWGAMRSDGSFTPGLVVGFKGGRGPFTHHKQPDVGSYVLHANGEAYLVDPGYFEPKPTDHTLPLIDGQGPGPAHSDIAETWEKGPWRYAVVDSTRSYGKAASRVRRLIVMHGDDRVVVLDDIVPAQAKPGKITTQFQTAWTPKLDAEATHPLVIRGERGALGTRLFGHDVKLAAKDRQFTNGWHWVKISEKGPGDWHSVAGDYTADPDRPLVTVHQPAAGDADPAAPPTVRYADGKVTVTFADRVSLAFKQTRAGWQFARP